MQINCAVVNNAIVVYLRFKYSTYYFPSDIVILTTVLSSHCLYNFWHAGWFGMLVDLQEQE